MSSERELHGVLRPDQPATAVRGVGPAIAARLRLAGIETVRDLLHFFPRRLEQIEDLDRLDTGALGRLVRVAGTVAGVSLNWIGRRRSVVAVGMECDDGVRFEVAFFNQPYLKKSFAVGERKLVEGVLDRRGDVFVVKQPRVARVDEDGGPCRLRYAEIDGVGEQRMRRLMRTALGATDLQLWHGDGLPAGLARDMPPVAEALRAMHAPVDVAEHERARRRYALLEACSLFRRVERLRRGRVARRGPRIEVNDELDARIVARLPFAWTGDQAAAVADLRARLAGPSPMGVLFQGDVGTGKTAVAVWAALAAIARGYQVAFLAPTELLAEQHFESVSRWLADSQVPLELLTAGAEPRARRALEARLVTGAPAFVIGTHALLSERTVFGKLGLVIVDEQHRFGVDQRMQLVRKGDDPHVLVMTATPIPRTLTLTLFGDLDRVVLREKPPGHRPARAVFVPREQWSRVLRAIDRRVKRGERVFAVAAKVGEDGAKGGATRLHEELAKNWPCDLVHGRMPPLDRQRVTAAFRDGETSVLVGTTVLEVGIDVPAATLMVVVGAENFGLATLHQLRGRVGRGARAGLCIVTGDANPRAAALCRTTDGFELAEQDLRLRGAGELLGTRQSGLGELRALDPVTDFELLQTARQAVRDE